MAAAQYLSALLDYLAIEDAYRAHYKELLGWSYTQNWDTVCEVHNLAQRYGLDIGPLWRTAPEFQTTPTIQNLLALYHVIQTTSEWTPVFIASSNRNVDIARYLCERGANTLLTDTNGKTPYMYACTHLGADSLEALLLKLFRH